MRLANPTESHVRGMAVQAQRNIRDTVRELRQARAEGHGFSAQQALDHVRFMQRVAVQLEAATRRHSDE